MIEYGLLKAGGGKAVGSLLMPGAALVIGGVLVWQLWQDKKAIRDLKQTAKDTKQLKQQLADLQTAHSAAAVQISSLQTELATATPASAVNVLPSLTTNSPQSPPSPSKLAMLKRLVEDNLNLRKNL